MENLDDIIQHCTESTTLDFKREEYKREKYSDLIKDVMAMANSHEEGIKRIIVGVKLLNDGGRDLLGISALTDEASFQQIIGENIEPELSLSYHSHIMYGKTFGVFEIADCQNRPYLVKKDYTPAGGGKKLAKGECFIRKGSTQMRVTRTDLDMMYKEQYEKIKDEDISIYLADMGYPFNYISIRKRANISLLPSEKAKENSENVYQENDLYSEDIDYVEKVYSHCNFIPITILNHLSMYLEKILVTISLPEIPGIKVYFKNENFHTWIEKFWILEDEIKPMISLKLDIDHMRQHDYFTTPDLLCFVVDKSVESQEIPLTATFETKTFSKIIKKTLTIKIE